MLLVLAMAGKGLLLTLPAPREVSAPHQFDTGRAMAQLQRLLGDERPHPVDSAANDRVRERLVGRLVEMGLRPQVTDDLSCNASGPRAISCARVRNVIATIGPADGKHLLVVSHYDSSPVGPGAADDGIGMAVMLETAATLSGAPLKRPVTFLFNEGEEMGLLGARAFLDRHPIARRVDSLVNLEARGVSGPALMFETSLPNGAAVGHYARSVSRPAANSLSTDFYRLIPNSTDVAVFDERPWTILNLAIIGNETRYHSPGDSFAALDRRSVQHMGDQTLALVRDLANGARPYHSGTWIFADLLGRELVLLPLEAGAVLLAVLILLAASIVWTRRRGWLPAMAAILAALIGSAALAFAGHSAVGLVRAGDYWRAHPEILSVAISTSAAVASLLALRWIGRSAEVRRLRSAFWLLVLLAGSAVAIVAPGGIIFFLLPPLVALTGMLLGRWHGAIEPAAAVVAACLTYLTLAPILHLVEMLLDFDSGWIFAPIAALILLPAMIELKPMVASAAARAVAGAGVLLLLAAWGAAALAPAYSIDRKQQFGIEYVRGTNDPAGRWMIVNDDAPLPSAMGSAFRPGAKVPYSARRRWSAPAPAAAAPAPGLAVVARRQGQSGRVVSVRLAAGGAESLLLRADGRSGLKSVTAGTAQRTFGSVQSDADYQFRCVGRNCDRLLVHFEIDGTAPLNLVIVGTRTGLPPAAVPLQRARPVEAAPQYSPDASIGIARATI